MSSALGLVTLPPPGECLVLKVAKAPGFCLAFCARTAPCHPDRLCSSCLHLAAVRGARRRGSLESFPVSCVTSHHLCSSATSSAGLPARPRCVLCICIRRWPSLRPRNAGARNLQLIRLLSRAADLQCRAKPDLERSAASVGHPLA